MTRIDFLKLIPAAILALLWPEAKAETLGPNQLRATSATFTRPVEFRHDLISPGFPTNGTEEEKREWWLKHTGVVEINNPERFFE